MVRSSRSGERDWRLPRPSLTGVTAVIALIASLTALSWDYFPDLRPRVRSGGQIDSISVVTGLPESAYWRELGRNPYGKVSAGRGAIVTVKTHLWPGRDRPYSVRALTVDDATRAYVDGVGVCETARTTLVELDTAWRCWVPLPAKGRRFRIQATLYDMGRSRTIYPEDYAPFAALDARTSEAITAP